MRITTLKDGFKIHVLHGEKILNNIDEVSPLNNLQKTKNGSNGFTIGFVLKENFIVDGYVKVKG